jgi:NAD(P)-dependent dehydrogenase (short-subunit alcohol dehydrogenase family)
MGAGPGIDILVNDAGNTGPGGLGISVRLGQFAESDPPDWNRYFAVNLFGVMKCTGASLPHMVTSGGVG